MKKENNYYVAIIGRPNVGKSSLFNRLSGKRIAVVLDEPKTTRDLIESEIENKNKKITLIDTAGHFKGAGTDIEKKSIDKILEAIEKSSRIIFVVDGEVPPTEEDKLIADKLRKTGKEVLMVVNKVDSQKKKTFTNEYERLGFNPCFEISTIHNLGISDLNEELFKNAPLKRETKKIEKDTVKIAILGRPNVGKSSLLNSLLKKEKAIVANESGTTRDIITEKVEFDNIIFSLSDTAGARKPGKIGRAYIKGQPIEKFAFLRTEKIIEDSDIILIVLDGSEGRATTQDLHIAGLAKEAGKGVVLVINKWDLNPGVTQEKYLHRLRNRFSFMSWVPAIFVSAKNGLNIEKIPEIIRKVSENQKRKIPTSKLNRILEDFAIQNLPKGQKGLKPKVYFASQTNVIPPTVEISAKHHQFIHFSWRRAFINHLRETYDFTGTPIKIIFKSKRSQD
ncbi:MAG: ribosome biogenesis GTPase Der [Patescibacteria group bacterium]|nr:ribosome biogenesis GTPase Der [Patescibacteria group bacterium]